MLAAAGVASRRACEELIASGRVTVNGVPVREQGVKVDPQNDEIRVDGDPILSAAPQAPIYVMLNKPAGVVSTSSDPNAERTVLDLVSQIGQRVYPVGRLDADSAGLLLLTNDGDFANRMTHPRYHVPKLYRVAARGFVDRQAAQQLMEGIELDDGKTAPALLRFVEFDKATQCTILDITLYEGRNRQVRRMMEAVGHPVRALERIGFGPLRLKGLLPGTWRKLREDEVALLLDIARWTPTPPASKRRDKGTRQGRPSQPPAPVAQPDSPVIEPGPGAPSSRPPRPASPGSSLPKGGVPESRPGRGAPQSGGRPESRTGRGARPQPPALQPDKPRTAPGSGGPSDRPPRSSRPGGAPQSGGRPQSRTGRGARPQSPAPQPDRPTLASRSDRPSSRPPRSSRPGGAPQGGGRPQSRTGRGARPQPPESPVERAKAGQDRKPRMEPREGPKRRGSAPASGLPEASGGRTDEGPKRKSSAPASRLPDPSGGRTAEGPKRRGSDPPRACRPDRRKKEERP